MPRRPWTEVELKRAHALRVAGLSYDAKMKLSSLVSPWCARLPILSSANASAYVVTLEEVESNVVATGSGAIDATGLTLSVTGFGMPPPNGTE